MKKQSTELGTEKISKLLVRLSLPAFIGMFVGSLYNVIDTIFIARGVGTVGVAALSIAFPIQMIIMAFAAAFGVGSASIISRRLGANRLEDANLVFGHMVWLIGFFSIVMAGTASLLLEPLLKLFGATAQILPYAKDYLSIILLGSVAFSFAMATNNIVRSEGNAKTAMLTMVIAAVINLILNPIFIFGLGWGMKGAALATIIGQATGAIWLFLYFYKGKGSLTLKWIGWKPNFTIIKEIIIIGMPVFVMMASVSLMFVSVNWMLVTISTELQIAIFGIISRVIAFTTMPINGIVQGMQPIIGYNFGAKLVDRLNQTVKIGIVVATMIATTTWIIVMLIPEPLMGIFSTDQAVIKDGALAMAIIFMLTPIIGFQMVVAGLFQALGKAKIAFVLSLSRQLIFLIPFVLILPHFYGLKGVWMAFPIADGLAFLLAFIIISSTRKQLLKSEEHLTDIEVAPIEQ